MLEQAVPAPVRDVLQPIAGICTGCHSDSWTDRGRSGNNQRTLCVLIVVETVCVPMGKRARGAIGRMHRVREYGKSPDVDRPVGGVGLERSPVSAGECIRRR